MIQWSLTGRARPVVAGCLLLATAAPLAAQEPLTDLLRTARVGMALDARGRLVGEGADMLISAGREARFFLVGEEHGVAEIPAITAALFRALVPHGYAHLAIETGDVLAAGLNRAVLAEDSGEAYVTFLRDHWPGAPFYNRVEEAALLRDAVTAAAGRADVLWGLDYDILADRYALRRLLDLAPDAAARGVVESVIARADGGLEQAMATGNPGLIFMFGGPTEVYAELRQAFAPTPGSEADRTLWLMEETRAINGLFMQRQGYESNRRRALLNKRQLARFLAEAEAAGGTPPRVMLKFGASHMVRGRTFTEVYDLGSLAAEHAEARGDRAFGVLMLAGAETLRSVMDPRVMRSVDAPAGFANEAWIRPVFDAAEGADWAVFDLRPLRPRIPALGPLPDELLKVLYGFDAIVILNGSGPQRDIELR